MTKEDLTWELYSACNDRSHTSEKVLEILKDNGLKYSDTDKPKLLDIIRPYKNSGKNLEATVDKIMNLLNMGSVGDQLLLSFED